MQAWTFADTARQLHVSRQRVHQLVHRGRLATITIRGRRYITTDAIRAYQLLRRHGHRPIPTEATP